MGPIPLRSDSRTTTTRRTKNNGLSNAGAFAFTSSNLDHASRRAHRSSSRPLQNFLTGNVATFSSQLSKDIAPDVRAQQWELYAQDDWRARPNLTFNIGLRYSMFRQPIDNNNELTTF